jgi:diguanylate cyclase (GGDEF)-like protein
MTGILSCEVFGHNVWMVLAAAGVCAAGCGALIGLYRRGLQTGGGQRFGWQFLAAFTAGASIWCTHFVAILAYRPGVPFSFDASLTIASSLTAVAGAAVSFSLAMRSSPRPAAALGGALLGASIASMHYLGMMAFRVEGLVSWNPYLIALSIFVACALAAASLHIETHMRDRFPSGASAALLAGAIVGLHFVGMSALRVTPLALAPWEMNGEASSLAIAVLTMTALVIGAAVVTFLLDRNLRAESESRLQEMALRDSLTGLPNRSKFHAHLSQALEAAKRKDGEAALIAIDLDDFKEINERFGHAAGDEFLKSFAERLRGLLRETEFVARVGGDEFAVFSQLSDPSALKGLIARLTEGLAQSPLPGAPLAAVRASMGVSLYPNDARDLETFIGNAELAMYRAKAERSVHPCFYQPAMDAQARRRRQRAADLRAAIAGDGLEVHYQKQARVDDGTTQSFEALARWPLPGGGYAPPAEFIPLAEECGLIDDLGDWVLAAACKAAVAWAPPFKVAVNLSPRQLENPNLVNRVAEILRDSGLPPQRLELELTESAVVRDPERSLSTIQAIKALGVTIALDDFGTGHSSLAILRQFPFDKIKLDRSFLWEIETDKQAKAILRAVLALGRSLGVPVLAEGIETEGQLQMLREEACDQAQGYLLGRPTPLARLVAEGEIALAGRRLPSAA